MLPANLAVIAMLLTCWILSPNPASAEDCPPSVPRTTERVAAQGKPLTLLGRTVAVGDRAPDFTVVDRAMKPVHLSDFAGEVRIITLFPSIDTQVCSTQVRTFNQEAAQLEGVRILAISMDLPFALERFCAAEGIDKVIALSDYRHRDFGLKYGFLIDELRLLARGAVIVDREGVVRYVEFVHDLAEQPNYQRIIETARQLTKPAAGA